MLLVDLFDRAQVYHAAAQSTSAKCASCELFDLSLVSCLWWYTFVGNPEMSQMISQLNICCRFFQGMLLLALMFHQLL